MRDSGSMGGHANVEATWYGQRHRAKVRHGMPQMDWLVIGCISLVILLETLLLLCAFFFEAEAMR